MNGAAPVTILTSATGLGVYIPALLLQNQLRSYRMPAVVEVMERYLTPDKQAAFKRSREAQTANFALAQMANRMTRDMSEALDPLAVDALLGLWAAQRRTHFILWSGFWLPLIERYRARALDRLHVDHCRIDATISASFRIHGQPDPCANVIWLWKSGCDHLPHRVPVTSEPPIPFHLRAHRLVLHGGGWRLGDHTAVVSDLRNTGFALDRAVHPAEPDPGRRSTDRNFAIDPGWEPWSVSDDGMHIFPPMGEIATGAPPVYEANTAHHFMHGPIRNSKAIISKPGGGTLIDSLAAATPVVFLDAYGDSEPANATVWKKLGAGIDYATWRATGFDDAVLCRMHHRLLALREHGIDYARSYAIKHACPEPA